jgi:predicted small secreted protein
MAKRARAGGSFRRPDPLSVASPSQPREGTVEMTLLRPTAFLLFALSLAACNTVEGAGEDLSRAGVVIQQEARAAE